MSWRAIGRLVLREARGARGRMVFLAACLAVGVFAVTGVAAVVAAIDGAVRRDARQVLAADVTLESRTELPDELAPFLAERGELERADVVEMASMARGAEGRSRLVELKSATANYPLHGALVTDPPGLRPGELAADEALPASDAAAALGVGVGDELGIGGRPYTVVGVVLDEPDRIDFALTLGPRVFLSPAGLDRSELVRFGSRIKRRVLLRFPETPTRGELRSFERDLRDAMPRDQRLRVRDVQDPSPGLRRALSRIEDYMGLVALLSLLVGGAGVAQVVRAWLASRTRAVAALKSLGMRPREVFTAYLLHVLLLAAAGCGVGALAGGLAPRGVSLVAPDLVPPGAVEALPVGPIVRGLVLGFAIALVFAVPPLTAVWRVPPARVLRAEAAPLPAPRLVRLVALALLVGGVYATALAQNDRDWAAAVFTGGIAGLVGLLALGARGLTALARRVPRTRLGPAVRHGVAALGRPGAGTVGGAIALGVGTLVVGTTVLVERRVADEFLTSLSPDAPSVFLVDVQPDQVGAVDDALAAHGASDVESTPVVMARLSEVDGTPVSELLEQRRRRRWMLTRELRVTTYAELQEGNTVLAGEWFTDDGRAEVSLEEDFADDLRVGVGDTLVFDVQGVPVEVVVTSLRHVDWSTFRINFFIVVEPGPLDDAPGWRLVAARVDEDREASLQDRLAADVPNVTVLRVRGMLEKLGGVFGRLAIAVRVLGAIAIVSGVLILAGAVAAGGVARAREAALLKVLGVTRRGVAVLFAVEYGLLGALAGALGGAGSILLAWVFLGAVLELPGRPPLAVVPLAAAAVAVLAAVAGLAASARALAVRPAATLRG